MLHGIDEKNLDLVRSMNGDQGIVSVVGKIPHYRGELVEINPECKAFDLLSKIFFKGPEPTIYISVIYNQEEKKLFISYPGKSKYRALDKKAVDSLFAKLQDLLGDNNFDTQKALFLAMYKAGNDILLMQLMDMKRAELIKKKQQQPNSFDLIKEIQPGMKTDKLSQVLLEEHYGEVLNILFDRVFPEIQTLSAIPIDMLEVMPYTNGPDHKYYGVHVEAKGIHHARELSPDEENFSIGLARRDNKLPGCCAGCAAEFDALKQVKGLEVKRSGDFPENFPQKNYVLSPNVIEDEEVTKAYSLEIASKLKEMGLCDKTREHSFWLHLQGDTQAVHDVACPQNHHTDGRNGIDLLGAEMADVGLDE